MPDGAHTAPDAIRWFWAYDAEGNRITEAEPVGVRICHDCHGAHPVADFVIAAEAPRSTSRRLVVALRPLGRWPRGYVQLAHSEFHPD